jgi:hypothetical protein
MSEVRRTDVFYAVRIDQVDPDGVFWIKNDEGFRTTDDVDERLTMENRNSAISAIYRYRAMLQNENDTQTTVRLVKVTRTFVRRVKLKS